MNTFKFTLASCVLLAAGAANAALQVYPMINNVTQQKASIIKVQSDADQNTFVKVTVKRVLNPGTPQEKEIAVADEDQTGLIVAPQKLILSPGTKRIIRLLSINAPAKEEVYRVNIAEVSPEDLNQSGLTTPQKVSSAQVGVTVVWSPLVFVSPAQPSYKISYIENSNKLFNSGTQHIDVQKIGECSSEKKCHWLDAGLSVYPGLERAYPKVMFKAGNQYRIKYRDWLTDKVSEMAISKK